MKTKRDFTADFAEIKKMTDKIKSVSCLNESRSFDDEYETEDIQTREMPIGGGRFEANEEDPQEQELQQQTNDPNSVINKIRELTLKGLLSLASNTDDPLYEVFRQIFQYIDRANKKKNEEEK